MPRLETRPHCPSCNNLSDGYTAMEKGVEPKAGDISICSVCYEILQFTEDMQLELASKEAIESCEVKITEAQKVARYFRAALSTAKNIRTGRFNAS